MFDVKFNEIPTHLMPILYVSRKIRKWREINKELYFINEKTFANQK